MRVALAVLLTLSGCAEISGLAGLDVCDGACADVTIDVAPPDASAADGAPPVLDAGTNDALDAPSSVDATAFPCNTLSDCKSTQVCCETLVTKGTQYPNCTVDADTVVCKSASECPSSTPSFQCGTLVMRRCNATADCTESSAPKCCTATLGDAGTREFCMSSTTAAVTNATCL